MLSMPHVYIIRMLKLRKYNNKEPNIKLIFLA